MTPAERIEAVEVANMTGPQRLSMLNFLIGALVPIAERPDPSPASIAVAVERAQKFGSLSK